MSEYGVRWNEFNRKDQLVAKEKIFATKKARDQFAKKLEKKDNFCSILAWLDEE